MTDGKIKREMLFERRIMRKNLLFRSKIITCFPSNTKPFIKMNSIRHIFLTYLDKDFSMFQLTERKNVEFFSFTFFYFKIGYLSRGHQLCTYFISCNY